MSNIVQKFVIRKIPCSLRAHLGRTHATATNAKNAASVPAAAIQYRCLTLRILHAHLWSSVCSSRWIRRSTPHAFHHRLSPACAATGLSTSVLALRKEYTTTSVRNFSGLSTATLGECSNVSLRTRRSIHACLTRAVNSWPAPAVCMQTGSPNLGKSNTHRRSRLSIQYCNTSVPGTGSWVFRLVKLMDWTSQETTVNLYGALDPM